MSLWSQIFKRKDTEKARLILTIPKWLTIAEQELGVAEIPGVKHSARILEYHKATELGATEDEVSWCSSFVNWVMSKADIARTHSALARSWLSWGVAITVPAFGCVIVLRRGQSQWQGHVGFYVGETTSTTVRVLGGNQGDAVTIDNFPKSKVLGYRWI